MLETVTLGSCAGTVAAPASVITNLFDLSLMRFQQRDDVAETFRKYNRKVRLWQACAPVANVRCLSVCIVKAAHNGRIVNCHACLE